MMAVRQYIFRQPRQCVCQGARQSVEVRARRFFAPDAAKEGSATRCPVSPTAAARRILSGSTVPRLLARVAGGCALVITLWLEAFPVPPAPGAASADALPQASMSTSAVAHTTPASPTTQITRDATLPPELRELWQGKIYASTFRAGFCLDKNGQARGVLLLRVPSGKVDVYHFHGWQNQDGSLVLKHSSGHRFTGRFVDAATIEGNVKLKSGFTIRMRGTRENNATLSADTCRPTPDFPTP